jgi:hypothetical protein
VPLDLPEFVGVFARPANRKVKVKDLDQFMDWLHVLADSIVVKVYAGDTPEERNQFKRRVAAHLRLFHGHVVTPNEDSLTFSTNTVNVRVEALAAVLHSIGCIECRILSFGMKWQVSKAQPRIDYFIQRHLVDFPEDEHNARNTFDYGLIDHQINRRMLNAFRFRDIQMIENGRGNRHFKKAKVHKMFGFNTGFGSISFKPTFHPAFEKVKIYPEMVHEVLSIVKRQTLDDMPKTVRTMHTRLEHYKR